MNREKWIAILKKSILCYCGMVVTAFGAIFLLRSGFGMDPMAVMEVGLANTFHITFGDAIIIVSTSLLVLALLFARRNIGIGTVFFVAFGGITVNYVEGLLSGILPKNGSYELWFQAVLFVFAILFVCMGLAMIVACRFGYNAGDALLFKIADKTHIQYRWLKIANDFLYVLAGYLLGGTVGLGTIFGAFVFGPLIVEIVKVYNKTILKWTGLQDERNEFKVQKKEARPAAAE